MDVSLAEDAMVPHALKHRFQISVSKLEGKPSSGNDPDPKPQPPQTQSFIGAPLEVGKPAVPPASNLPDSSPVAHAWEAAAAARMTSETALPSWARTA
jgi:hypothetical protein